MRWTKVFRVKQYVEWQTEFLSKGQKLFSSFIRYQGEGKEDFRRRFLPIYYIVGRRQKRSGECGRSFFRQALVLKAQKARVFKAFLAFGRGFQRSSVGVFLPKKAYKKDTLQSTECLIVFNLFFLRIRTSVESKSFCTFGLNSGCLITTKTPCHLAGCFIYVFN